MEGWRDRDREMEMEMGGEIGDDVFSCVSIYLDM
jgi:hypothetical protein